MFRFACRRFTLLPLAAALAAPLSPAVAQTGDNQLEPVTVTATRTNSALGETPQKITVVTREQIEEQLAITGDQAQVLSNLLPSYSPSRQKLTNAGETIKLVGKLPKGLKFSSTTGLLSGRITGKAATYPLTVQFLQGKTVVRTVSLPLTILPIHY